ncbi:helix-turn-helix transcriptional regulator [Vagococcus sp. BWB3-3]|uniref:Helix-turn-helix transcriptional regulator n=1 Tax=Vagococcus allomyrinae TaxID=2794353 RepID=A0A940PCS5_9ENTE|nr:helix-turn-helix transcriptional regulator [Vagococcus allomyrinae]MBP1042564.1 helix-turn-helix transcriptional regulator [Vagococcus allomyrinae]
MQIGEKIKEYRLRKELTQEQLGTLLNVSRSTISGWEVGRNYPDLRMIVTLSDLLEISLDTLLREDVSMVESVSKSSKRMRFVMKGILALSVLLLVFMGVNLYWYRQATAQYNELASWETSPTGYTLADMDGKTIYNIEKKRPRFLDRPQPLAITTTQQGMMLTMTSDKQVKLLLFDSPVSDIWLNKANQFDETLNQSAYTKTTKAAIVESLKEHQQEIDQLRDKTELMWAEVNF